LREKVRTTNFKTSKTKKNIKNHANHHNIKKAYKKDQNVKKGKDQNIEKPKITTSKLVDHYYENHNVEKNEKNIEKISLV
jgi:hypothetical protein